MHTSPQDTFTYCFSLSNGRDCQSDAYSINWILSHYEPPLWSCTIRPMWHDDIRNKGTLIARTSLHLSGIVEILDLMGSRKKNIFWLLLHGDLYFAKQKRNQKHGNTEGVWKTANQPNKSKLQTRYYNMFHFTSIQLQWHRPFNSPCNGAKPSRSILSPFGEQLRAEWSAGAEGDWVNGRDECRLASRHLWAKWQSEQTVDHNASERQ